MKHPSTKLFIISLLMSVIALFGVFYYRELAYSEALKNGLFSIILICNLISCIGLYLGFHKKNRKAVSWIGIVGNLILIIPLSYLSYRYIKYLTHKPDLKILKLESFSFKDADINDGEQVNILSFTYWGDCTKEITYYYSVIAINTGTKDTIRILTPCQLLSSNFQRATFNLPEPHRDSILSKVGLDFGGEQLVVINNDLPFQQSTYDVVIGTLSFQEQGNEILKEHLIRNNKDTNILEAPIHEIEYLPE